MKKLIDREPTKAMDAAGKCAVILTKRITSSESAIADAVFRAMWEAAPVIEQEPIGEMREIGVVWFDKNPHAFPLGTKYYTTPQPCSRCADYERLSKVCTNQGIELMEQLEQITTLEAQNLELEEERNTWKERAEFSYQERSKLEKKLAAAEAVIALAESYTRVHIAPDMYELRYAIAEYREGKK